MTWDTCLRRNGLLFALAALCLCGPTLSAEEKGRTLNARDFGAVGDDRTDNSAAFSACLDALIKMGGGRMTIPDGIYRGRIAIPGTKDWLTIEIVGESAPTPVFGTIGAFPFPSHGTVLRCLEASGEAAIVARDTPGRLYASFSGAHVVLRNLDVRTYDNPGIGGIDLRHAAQCRLENIFVNTGRYNVQASRPTHGTAGVATPACNNAALTVLRNVTVTGYDTGILVNEHTDADNINLASNLNGLAFAFAHHASRFGRVGAFRCTRNVAVLGAHAFTIEQLDSEVAGKGQTDEANRWQATEFHLHDPRNLAAGSIRYWIVEGGVGAVDRFSRLGGASVQARRIGTSSEPEAGR